MERRSSPTPTSPVDDGGPTTAMLMDALSGIRLYANDTLSGRADGPTDASWYSEGIIELRNRARDAMNAADALLTARKGGGERV